MENKKQLVTFQIKPAKHVALKKLASKLDMSITSTLKLLIDEALTKHGVSND